MPSPSGVAVERVVGDGHVCGCFAEIVGQRIRIDSLQLVVDEVLQMVGIAALFGRTEDDHRLGNKDPSLGLPGRHVVVHDQVGIMERLDLRSDQAPAIFRTHGEEPLPHVVSKPARPQFQRPISGKLSVAPADRFLHSAADLAEIVTPDGGEFHSLQA